MLWIWLAVIAHDMHVGISALRSLSIHTARPLARFIQRGPKM